MSEPLISFKTKPYAIGSTVIVRVPKLESLKLPSRGLVMVSGLVDGRSFEKPIEPDGEGSHYIELPEETTTDTTIEVTLNLSKNWPEPTIPNDIMKALSASKDIEAVWGSLTSMSRWDWVRWVTSTKNAQTRAHRVVVMISKMENGKRRACCFDRTICANPAISRNGTLVQV